MPEDDQNQQTIAVSKTQKLEDNFKKLLKDYISEGGLDETTAQALYAKFKNYKTDDERETFYNKANQSFEAATENYGFISEYNKRERLFNDTMELNGAMEAYLDKYIAEQEAQASQDEISLTGLNQEALLNQQLYKTSSSKVYKNLDDLIANKAPNTLPNNHTSFEHSSNLRDLNQTNTSNLPDLEAINLNIENTKQQEAQQESQFQSFQTAQTPNNTNVQVAKVNNINSNYFKSPYSTQAFQPVYNPNNQNNTVNNSTLPPFLQQNPNQNIQNPNKTEYPNFYQG
jgi:hypothetical protein